MVSSATKSSPTRIPIVFWLLLAIGIALRFPLLDYSFYGDEWFSVVRDSQRLLTDTEDRFRPLFFSLLYLWKQVGFEGEVGLRSLSLFFGLLQIPLAFLIGSRLRDTYFGILLTAMVAVSPVLIEFSQELRMYSMITTIGMLQLRLYLKLESHRTLPLWIAFIATALAGAYTHIFYWLFLLGFALTFYRVRERLPLARSSTALGVILLLYLPNILNVIEFVRRRADEYPMHFQSAIPKLLAAFTVGYNYFYLPDQGASRAISLDILRDNMLYLLPVTIASLLILTGFIRLARNRTPAFWLSFELFIVPSLIATIASYISGKYFLQPKYLIFCAPVFLLLILESIRMLSQQWIRRTVAGLGLLLAVIAILHYWNPSEYGRKENWRGLVTKINTMTEDELYRYRGAHILSISRLPLMYYYDPTTEYYTNYITPPDHILTPDDPATREFWSQLPPGTTYHYIYWDTRQNKIDLGNYLVKSMTNLMVTTNVDSLNPRLRLYTWKVPVN